jgi:hypothetical protein
MFQYNIQITFVILNGLLELTEHSSTIRKKFGWALLVRFICNVLKVKGKVHPKKATKGLEGE